MPAFAQRMLMGPKWSWACLMQEAIEASSEISPWTVKILALLFVSAAAAGLRSCAVTLHPAAYDRKTKSVIDSVKVPTTV